MDVDYEYYEDKPEAASPEIIDEAGNSVENPDLELGWLKNETKIIHHAAVEGVKEETHFETDIRSDGTPAIYYDANGKEYGRDVHEVIDVPGVKARDAYDEEVEILRYVKYTEEELAQRKAEKEKAEARQKAIDALPETLEALKAAQSDTDSLMVDLTYRQMMLELGLDTEDEE